MSMVVSKVISGIFQTAFKTKTPKKEEAHPAANNDWDPSLFDLLCIGVGATLGSGVFVVNGLVAHAYSGPSVIISWIIAGVACLVSAAAFAELANKMPHAASSYSFTYAVLGEWPAYLAAWGLTLECGISSSAVSRSWGTKVMALLEYQTNKRAYPSAEQDPWGLNVFAALLQVCTVLLFLLGNDVSKAVVNSFTVFKVFLIAFMIIVGLFLWKSENIQPFTPYGMSGVLRGSTACFFGFVGYDEVCCMALESNNAQKLMPTAVFGTILIVSLLYALSSIALVGAQDYRYIDPENGFTMAFDSRNCHWAAVVTAVGELISLPVVVIVSFLPQPRIMYAMAKDHLCPAAFQIKNENGVLLNSILWTGLLTIAVAAFVPFNAMDDLVSAGVLLSYNFTNSSLIILRLNDQRDTISASLPWSRCKSLLSLFHIVCILLTMHLFQLQSAPIWTSLSLFNIAFIVGLLITIAIIMFFHCKDQTSCQEDFYRVPLVPFTPLLGIAINYVLISQLSRKGMMLFFAYFSVVTVLYILQVTILRRRSTDVENLALDDTKSLTMVNILDETAQKLPAYQSVPRHG